MAFRRVELPAGVPGALWLSSMPGRWEPWANFIDEARRTHLALTLCLTEPSEVAELSPDYRQAIDTGTLPGTWINVPMRNYDVADDAADLRDAVDTVARTLREGGAVLLHCAAGMGRTGTAAACVLKRLGLPVDEALRRVRDAGSNPQSAVQSGLVNWF
ncbi:dual specificity protein phosphatase family protein [Ideonella sp.]|uniref:protein-tyrosine phosphatase family protein n=1 Tax=Ideonella sp. TaxID=1929293 RepID=UPI0035B38EBD